MKLAPRLAVTFGLLAALSTVVVGFAIRQQLQRHEAARFAVETRRVCERIRHEIERQGEADQKLIGGACQGGELVDRVDIAIRGERLDEQRMGFAQVVREERSAFDLDELLLFTDRGDVIGASPTSLLATPRKALDTLAAGPPKWAFRLGETPAIVARCVKPGRGHRVALVGARRLDPVLERLGTTLQVRVTAPWQQTPPPLPGAAEATLSCELRDATQAPLSLVVTKSTAELTQNLHTIDRTVLASAAASSLVALVLAVLLARSLSRPLSDLAREAGKVAAGEARPLHPRLAKSPGSSEVKEVVQAFDEMVEDLAMTRRRLAAASRVAAWREVARRVAHEVKNPLAPIRAAVETLRRLRAREDPAFDEYFDEATRTVLDEVHRISNIVTEFTRFARLPQPRPQDVDLDELARHVVRMHAPTAEASGLALELVRDGKAPTVRADRDQVVQVLTNLVQNAIDAAKDGGSEVRITLAAGAHGAAYVTVSDDGPGVAPELEPRLFEPYATTKPTGTGLGLAIAQRIALEHGGELAHVGAGPSGRGAAFRLVLTAEGPPPASEVPPDVRV